MINLRDLFAPVNINGLSDETLLKVNPEATKYWQRVRTIYAELCGEGFPVGGDIGEQLRESVEKMLRAVALAELEEKRK